MRKLVLGFAAVLGVLFGSVAHGTEKSPVLVGLDAEFGHKSSTSAVAIQRGIEIAIDEVNRAGGVLGGRPLKLVTRDNRSVAAMGVDNFREFAAEKDLVAVFGGKFSPVYLEQLPVAHSLGLLLLDPWGSADPITDHDYRPNYSFRLSLKDAWAAPALLRFAKGQHKAKQVGVLLPNTGWGRSNQAALMKAAPAAGVTIVGQRWFNWGEKSLLPQYRELQKAGAQAIIFITNEVEGALLVREMASLPPSDRLPIISHWGVTGGAFAEMSGDALDQVDFAVIQTYSFIGDTSPIARRVLGALKDRYGLADPERIPSPVGVAHAYDLMHLLAKAIQSAGSTNRARIRDAMERLGPYQGLVRRYAPPFTSTRHDALGSEQVFMARYTADDRLLPLARLKQAR